MAMYLVIAANEAHFCECFHNIFFVV